MKSKILVPRVFGARLNTRGKSMGYTSKNLPYAHTKSTRRKVFVGSKIF